MRGQIKTGTTMLDNIKEYFKNAGAFLFGSDDIVTDINEIDNWGDFHGENQEEIEDMARIAKAETSLGVAKQKMNRLAKAKQTLGNLERNPEMRPNNRVVESKEELEEQKTR